MDDTRTSPQPEGPQPDTNPESFDSRDTVRPELVALGQAQGDPEASRRVEGRAARRPLIGHLEIWIAAAIVVLDQVAKALVRARVPLHDDVEVIRGMLDITYVRNSGAAFGMFNTIDFPFKSAIIAIVAAGALVAIAAYAARVAPAQRLARLGLALIVGGAVGNLIDRVAFGYVVDFVDVYWRSYHFWAFNVADSAISVGVAVMVLDMLGLGSHASNTV